MKYGKWKPAVSSIKVVNVQHAHQIMGKKGSKAETKAI